MDQTIEWLRGLAAKGGKGVVDNIDARSLGRIADDIVRIIAERDEWNAGARRLAACLIAINKAPATIPASILREIAYDAALNCITPDVAEFQILRRSALQIEG